MSLMEPKKNAELKDLRCPCGKLLGKSNSRVEIKCSRCNRICIFDEGKLLEQKNI